MQKKNLLTKEVFKEQAAKKVPKVKKGPGNSNPVWAQYGRQLHFQRKADFMDTDHSFKQPYKEQDLVILLNPLTGSELVVKIQKITNQEEVYVKHHKGKHSSQRDQWLVGIDSIVRLATPKEIRAAELRG